MSDHIDEAWEFYCPDPEVAEIFAADSTKHERGLSIHQQFLFKFQGNHDAGRFFDGIGFGKRAVQMFAYGDTNPNVANLFF